jgi:TolB protein
LAALLMAAPATAQPPPAPPPAAPAQSGAEPPPLEVDIVGGISAPMPIAIPAMPTPASASTPAGETAALGQQVAAIVAADLKSSGLFTPTGPGGLPPVAFPQVAAPDFSIWSGTGAQALVQGFVQANGDGNLTVGCYLYDTAAKTELTRQGFVVTPALWRRAAHKCADMVYTRLTGEGPYFDSRVVYVSETGPKARRTKRLAIMDQDGANHRFLTNGQSVVLTPRFAPNQQTIVYMSYVGDKPRAYVYDIGSGRQRLLVSQPYMTFAPRFSPDGRWVIFSMSVNGNTDIYRVAASGGEPQRLTDGPGIDTGGSYSPDGRHIVFESDRGGSQQLYVMNADGSGQRRISFGAGTYATPVWSPRGDLIAFTARDERKVFDVFTISPETGKIQRVTQDQGRTNEEPTWAPNGLLLAFTSDRGGRPQLVVATPAGERQAVVTAESSELATPAWGPFGE